MTATDVPPEPAVNPLDTPEVRDLIAASLDHPSVYMGGPSRQSKAKAERMIRDLAPHVAAAQRAASRATRAAAIGALDPLFVHRPAGGDLTAQGIGNNAALFSAQAAIGSLPTPAAFAAPEPSVAEALRPFAEIGQWLFARDLPNDTPLVEAGGINGYGMTLTRGHFKAAHRALQALTESTPGVTP